MKGLEHDLTMESIQSKLKLNILKYEEGAVLYSLEGDREAINNKCRIYKKLPPFYPEQINYFLELLDSYHQILDNYCINTPSYQLYLKEQKPNKIYPYIAHNNIGQEHLCQNILPNLSSEDCLQLARNIILSLLPIFRSNLEEPDSQVGIDSHITNWALPGFRETLTGDEKLFFLATSTPFIKEKKKEKCSLEFYFHSVPGFIKPVFRLVYLQEMLERYYNPREVILNLVTSFIEEGRSDITLPLIKTVNPYFTSHLAGHKLKPINLYDLMSFQKRNRYLKDILFISRLLQKSYVEKIKRQKFDFPMPHCRVAANSMHVQLMKGRKLQRS